ncbi:hypothetical protein SDC9_171895 [bioreactor metagenome]|uniref:Uncharacterized protein n=1 Tax=bioreactor metagenome TaxID=1076179 RepID=A0A645GEB9_9ZZZZ
MHDPFDQDPQEQHAAGQDTEQDQAHRPVFATLQVHLRRQIVKGLDAGQIATGEVQRQRDAAQVGAVAEPGFLGLDQQRVELSSVGIDQGDRHPFRVFLEQAVEILVDDVELLSHDQRQQAFADAVEMALRRLQLRLLDVGQAALQPEAVHQQGNQQRRQQQRQEQLPAQREPADHGCSR